MAETEHRVDDADFDGDEFDDEMVSSPPRAIGSPSLIVDGLHVKYRVFGGKRRSVVEERPSAARRLITRASGHVGAVSEVHAVRGVSFVARHGESIGLIGRNGAGKSTLLRAVAGLIPAASGAVYVDGTSALLGVNAALDRGLSGERNILLGGLALGLTPVQVRERFDSIVEFAGLGEFITLPMNAYSSGMAARLRFAISTATVPDVLMIDEALATGDAAFRARARERIEEIRDAAGTVFVVSHSTATIERMCDRAIWLDAGEIHRDGPADEVVSEYKAYVKELQAKRK